MAGRKARNNKKVSPKTSPNAREIPETFFPVEIKSEPKTPPKIYIPYDEYKEMDYSTPVAAAAKVIFDDFPHMSHVSMEDKREPATPPNKIDEDVEFDEYEWTCLNGYIKTEKDKDTYVAPGDGEWPIKLMAIKTEPVSPKSGTVTIKQEPKKRGRKPKNPVMEQQPPANKPKATPRKTKALAEKLYGYDPTYADTFAEDYIYDVKAKAPNEDYLEKLLAEHMNVEPIDEREVLAKKIRKLSKDLRDVITLKYFKVKVKPNVAKKRIRPDVMYILQRSSVPPSVKKSQLKRLKKIAQKRGLLLANLKRMRSKALKRNTLIDRGVMLRSKRQYRCLQRQQAQLQRAMAMATKRKLFRKIVKAEPLYVRFENSKNSKIRKLCSNEALVFNRSTKAHGGGTRRQNANNKQIKQLFVRGGKDHNGKRLLLRVENLLMSDDGIKLKAVANVHVAKRLRPLAARARPKQADKLKQVKNIANLWMQLKQCKRQTITQFSQRNRTKCSRIIKLIYILKSKGWPIVEGPTETVTKLSLQIRLVPLCRMIMANFVKSPVKRSGTRTQCTESEITTTIRILETPLVKQMITLMLGGMLPPHVELAANGRADWARLSYDNLYESLKNLLEEADTTPTSLPPPPPRALTPKQAVMEKYLNNVIDGKQFLREFEAVTKRKLPYQCYQLQKFNPLGLRDTVQRMLDMSHDANNSPVQQAVAAIRQRFRREFIRQGIQRTMQLDDEVVDIVQIICESGLCRLIGEFCIEARNREMVNSCECPHQTEEVEEILLNNEMRNYFLRQGPKRIPKQKINKINMMHVLEVASRHKGEHVFNKDLLYKKK